MGINLTSRTTPKSALLQTYDQLPSVRKGEINGNENNSEKSSPSDNSDPTVMDYPGNDTNKDTMAFSLPAVTQDNVSNSNHPVQDIQTHGLLQGLTTAMQGTTAMLQPTVNSLQQKQTGTTAVNTVLRWHPTATNILPTASL